MFGRSGQDLLKKWKEKLEKSTRDAMADAVREVGVEALEQMQHNLSGAEVSWSGGEFRVNVRTGNLRRHCRLEYPFAGDPHSAYVFNNAAYAQDLEQGLTGEERKDRLLFGGKAPKENKQGRPYKTIPGGKGSLIPFWTVHADSRLRDQAPRPFAQATAEQMQSRAVELVGNAVIDSIVGGSS